MYLSEIITLNRSNVIKAAALAGSLGVNLEITSFLYASPFKKPRPEVVKAALAWSDALSSHGFQDLAAFPGHGGEIEISGLRKDECFEVIVEADLTYSVSFEKGDEQVFYLSHLSFKEALAKLRGVAQQRWISSVGFTPNISTVVRTGSSASLFVTPPGRTAAYRSSMTNVHAA